jgi:DNA-binding IscR family transcriptional regulator
VIEQALQQIPAEQIADVEIVVRADSAGATHDLLDICREAACATRSATNSLRAAILKVPQKQWIASLATDGSPRPNGQIVEITDPLDLTAGPRGRA